jgi:hypothetical protein
VCNPHSLFGSAAGMVTVQPALFPTFLVYRIIVLCFSTLVLLLVYIWAILLVAPVLHKDCSITILFCVSVNSLLYPNTPPEDFRLKSALTFPFFKF